jgi:Sulfotransferase family
MLAMLTYTARMHCSPVPVHEIAATWVDRLELMLNALVRDRHVLPPDRSVDVRFDDFMADEMGVASQIYDLAGEAMPNDARRAIADYLTGHERGRLGRIATSAEMFGLDEHDVHARFAPYVKRFLS